MMLCDMVQHALLSFFVVVAGDGCDSLAVRSFISAPYYYTMPSCHKIKVILNRLL